jgi:predicted Zn finger-like uncharacterized protein
MLIDCPDCAYSYHIDRAVLEPNGRSVACPRCSAVWYVGPESGEGALPPPDQLEISAEAISHKADAAPAPRVGGKKRIMAQPLRLAFSPRLWLCVAVVSLAMASMKYRAQVVRLWPQAATAYAALGLPVNLRGLALHDLHMVLNETAGEPFLGIEGEITNVRPAENRIPLLRLSLRDAQSREIYAWTAEAPKRRLTIGESVKFEVRLASPPPAAQALLVSFAPAAHEGLALQR